MKCPHCQINFHDNWSSKPFYRDPHAIDGWRYQTAICPGCKEVTVEIYPATPSPIRVYPLASDRDPAPSDVPAHIARNYSEACLTLTISPMASAALARRCLQTVLVDHHYSGRDLAKQIDSILKESDPRKAIPQSLRDTIDSIRSFGNFSAHPINDLTTLQIIDVEPHEAEWCLDILVEMFDHFYVKPAVAKARKAALDAKLNSAGKPPSK